MATREPMDCYHDAVAAALEWRHDEIAVAHAVMLCEFGKISMNPFDPPTHNLRQLEARAAYDEEREKAEHAYNEWLEIEAAYYGIEI